MSDPLASLRVQAASTRRTFEQIERSSDRASMFAVREAGRMASRAARKAAPVLKGEGVSRKQASAGRFAVSANAPVRGLLRSSIHSSKRLLGGRGSYAVHVAPRGERVHLYSQKVEAQAHYMAQAHAAVAPELHAIATRAWTRATRKG